MRRQTKKLEVKRMFEPNRLSRTNLEKAYERILPKQIRVIEHPPNRVTDESLIKEQPVGRKIR